MLPRAGRATDDILCSLLFLCAVQRVDGVRLASCISNLTWSSLCHIQRLQQFEAFPYVLLFVEK